MWFMLLVSFGMDWFVLLFNFFRLDWSMLEGAKIYLKVN